MKRYLHQTLDFIRKWKYDDYISYKLCATIRKSHTNKLISCGYNRSFSGHHCHVFNGKTILDYNCNAIHAEQDAILIAINRASAKRGETIIDTDTQAVKKAAMRLSKNNYLLTGKNELIYDA